MVEQGHQIMVIAPFNSPLFLRAKKMGYRVYPLSFNLLARFGEYAQLKKLFTTETPFAVNCHGSVDARLVLKAARQTGVPCRIMSQHADCDITNLWHSKRKYNQYCHYTFTDSPRAIPRLQKKFNINDIRIFSIPQGITVPQDLLSNADAQKAISSKLELPPATRFMGLTSQRPLNRMGKRILQIFDAIPPQSSWHMLVISTGDQSVSAAFKQDMVNATHGRIHFLEINEGAWSLYRALDFMVHLSINDNRRPACGIPRHLLEMMYAQCPVIAPHHSEITEFINRALGIHHDHNGQDTSLEQMTAAAVSGQKSDQIERAAAIRDYIKQHHTINAMGRDILRMYQLRQVRLEQRHRR